MTDADTDAVAPDRDLSQYVLRYHPQLSPPNGPCLEDTKEYSREQARREAILEPLKEKVNALYRKELARWQQSRRAPAPSRLLITWPRRSAEAEDFILVGG